MCRLISMFDVVVDANEMRARVDLSDCFMSYKMDDRATKNAFLAFDTVELVFFRCQVFFVCQNSKFLVAQVVPETIEILIFCCCQI